VPFPHMQNTASPTSASSIVEQLVNNESTSVVMCTPVYSNAAGGFKKALGDGSAKSAAIGIVIDQLIAAGKQGAVIMAGAATATTAQWDAVCGTSGGLAFGTLYYLSASAAGILTTSSASGIAVLEGLSPTIGKLLGAGGGSAGGSAKLSLIPAPDPFGGGVNMPEGVVNNYTDPSIASKSFLIWKGADNQGTILTGIDSTGVSPGDVKFFLNLSESGIDAGNVVIRHQDTGSSATNRIVTPDTHEYMCPCFGLTILIYGSDLRWHIATESGWAKKVVTQALHFYPNMQVGTNASPISGTLNDWDPTGEALFAGTLGIAGSNCLFRDHTLIRVLTAVAGATITGLHTGGDGTPQDFGPVKVFLNQGPGFVTFKHLSGSSAVENRLNCPNSRDLIVPPGGSAIFQHPYDFAPAGATPQWWCLAPTQSEGDPLRAIEPTVPLSAGNIDSWNPADASSGLSFQFAQWIRVAGNGGGTTLRSMVAPNQGHGTQFTLTNYGTGITVKHNAGVAGTNFYCPGAVDLTWAQYKTIHIIYDSAALVYMVGD
jgi:hypothetical protein